MSAFLNRHRFAPPLLVMLIALAMHFHYWSADKSHASMDTPAYLANADSLAAGAGFMGEDGQVEARRTPAYPLFLAPLRRAGFGPRGIAAVQHVAAALLAGSVYLFGLFAFGRADFAAAAALVVALDPGQALMANFVMTETLMSITLFGACAAALAAKRRDSVTAAIVAGVLCGVTVLVRPIAILLFVAVVVWALTQRLRLRIVVALLVASVVLPLGWAWRNHQKVGLFTLSSIGGEVLYYFRAAGVEAMPKTGFQYAPLPHFGEEEFRHQFFRVTQREFVTRSNAALEREYGARAATLHPATVSSVNGRLAREIMLNNIPGTILVTINGALHLIFDGPWNWASALFGLTRIFVFYLLFLWSVVSFVLAIVGFRRLRREGKGDVAILSLLVLLYFLGVSSGTEFEQWRYRIPLIPVYALLVGPGIIAVREAWADRRRQKPGQHRVSLPTAR